MTRSKVTRPSQALLVAPPTGPARRWTDVLIVAVVLLQLLAPLRYYLAEDPYDERFAWRMFSSLGERACDFALSETSRGSTRPVSLAGEMTEHWLQKLAQRQPRVVRAVLRRRCGRTGVRSVRYERRCTAPSGALLAAEQLSIDCATGAVRSDEALP